MTKWLIYGIFIICLLSGWYFVMQSVSSTIMDVQAKQAERYTIE